MCLVKMRSETGKVYSVECVVIGSCVWFIPKERKRIQISLVRRLCGGGVGTDHKHGEAMRSFLSTIFLEKKVVNFEAVTVALLCVRPHHTSIL